MAPLLRTTTAAGKPLEDIAWDSEGTTAASGRRTDRLLSVRAIIDAGVVSRPLSWLRQLRRHSIQITTSWPYRFPIACELTGERRVVVE